MIAASILACDSSGVPNAERSDAPASSHLGAEQAPLVELGLKCAQAGGQFVSGECVCPTVEVSGVPVRETFDARFATCALPPSPGDSPCVLRGGFESVLDKEGMTAFRECLHLLVYPFRSLIIEFPQRWSSEDARPLAKWLDARFKPGAIILNAKLSTPVTTNSIDIMLGSESIEEARLMVGVRPLPIDPGDLSFAATRYLHVPSVDTLDRALGDSTAPLPARNTVPPFEADFVGNTVESSIESAIEETRLDLNRATAVDPLLQGCLGMCDVRQDYTFGEDGPIITAWRVRRYQTGVLYSEMLAVGSPDRRRIDGLVLFDLGGEPSLILRVERSSPLRPTVFAYDRNWKWLGSFPFDLLPDERTARLVANAALPLADGEAGIVLCDSGITFDDANVNSALLVGDHLPAAEKSSGSLFGWLNAPASDVASFLDGVRGTALGIMPFEAFPTIHGGSIASILLERHDPKLRIVSASAERCARRPDALKGLATWDLTHASEFNKKNGRIRVVNLSASDYVDADACATRFPTGLDSHYLWVTAAGNSGRRYTIEAPLARCPQALPNRGNLLVVAGAEASNSPWRDSDFGSTYADLAADCTGQNGRCSGTSNSAPRVARTAALIVQKYGDSISNEMVRMAILLGVSLPSRVPPYRSGGYHNHNNAMTAAGKLIEKGIGQRASMSMADASKVLDSFLSDVNYKKRKLDTLRANGAFDG